MTTINKFYIPVYLSKKQGINPVFIKANSFLLTKFKDRFDKSISDFEKFDILKSLWIQEFKAYLIEEITSENKTIISKIQFYEEETMTMFLLRWS
jgi:hypothetical protein